LDVSPLAVVGGTPGDTDRYNHWLERRLNEISPSLVETHLWPDELMTGIFGHPWLTSLCAEMPLQAQSTVLTNEIKSYLVAAVRDDRKARTDWFLRRIPVVNFLVEEGGRLLNEFSAECLADIPHPNFLPLHDTSRSTSASNNPMLLVHFAAWYKNRYKSRRLKQKRTWVRDGKFQEDEYHAPEVQLIGDIHRFSIINRAQMKPIAHRDIILFNDIYDEEDTRFRDRQRRSDFILNLTFYQPWLRPFIRAFVLDKVTHGELAPGTIQTGLVAQMRRFARFLDEKGITSPAQVNDTTIELYLAWGNTLNIKGKNWYTDVVQLLRAAPILRPGEWNKINLDRRATRRIRYKQAPDDPRNRLYASREGANRAASSNTIAAILEKLDDLPQPIPVVFALGVATGARAEDLHALLFDCLRPDTHDPRFMILTFWQNKVSRWNSKPLLLSDPVHKNLIDSIEQQRERVRSKHGRETKYLFPSFSGKREVFLDQAWSLQELKKLCLQHGITDDDGNPVEFSWHPIRHYRGTQMASEGHDILSIMFELGHASPDMASMYVNKRLELKKNALLRKGGGKFYTIEGRVDEAVSDLLIRKDAMVATRVCGGACTLPGQVGEWCEHAHACLTCKFFRADSDDVEHFRCERSQLYSAIESLEQEAQDYDQGGQKRMAAITRKRLQRNKDAVQNTDTIIRSIEEGGSYAGKQSRYKPAPAQQELLL
jgi:site-specific recombinase XerD